MGTILVTLNYLGTPVSKEYIDCLLDGQDHSGDFDYGMILHVLGLPPENLPREVLERYVEISSKESYMPIFPHTDKIFERLLVPFKSAKRTYCFGEYLACIELSAHLGEMLALLLWQITPMSLNGKSVNEQMEKSIFGSEFEKMGQEKRINLLKVVDAISTEEEQLLDFLRATRRKYFHFWNTSTDQIKEDAVKCFLKVATLVQKILKIEYEKGAVKMNPLLAAYLATHKTPA